MLHGKIEPTCNINLIVCFSPPRFQGIFRLEEIFFLILSLVKVLSVWFKKKMVKLIFFLLFISFCPNHFDLFSSVNYGLSLLFPSSLRYKLLM